MRSFFHTCKHLIGAALLLGVPACDWIHDDSLPPCEFRLHYVYDYNMKFADAFLKYGLVAVVPGSGFGAPNFVRWSYATSMENIKEGLDRLEKFLAE